MPPSIANMYGCYIVAFAFLQGVTSCRKYLLLRLHPFQISTIIGKCHITYVTGPAKSTKSFYWMKHFRADMDISEHTIINVFTENQHYTSALHLQ